MTGARVILAVTVLSGGFAVAAEPPSTDDALLRRLLGEPETAGPAEPPQEGAESPDAPAEPPDGATALPVDPQAVERILAGLRNAERRLTAGETGEPTRAAQSEVIAELERLIEAAKGQASRSQSDPRNEPKDGSDSGSPQQQPSGAAAAEPMPTEGTSGPAGASGVPAGSPDRNRDGKAEESSDRLRDERDPTGLIRGFRSDLARDAWGHLPPRLREQLLNTGPDKYLPQYDSLVRRYFESLARPDGPPPQGGDPASGRRQPAGSGP